MNDQHQMHAALQAAKIEQDHATAALAVAAETASADDREVEAWRETVTCLKQSRARHIHEGAVAAVLGVDTDLLQAAVSAEIAIACAASTHRHHTAAVKELQRAERAVVAAEAAEKRSRMIAIAIEAEKRLDSAEPLIAMLQTAYGADVFRAVNLPLLAMPPEVERVLARRRSARDDVHTAVSVLRNGTLTDGRSA